MNTILSRMREPSSWAGLALLISQAAQAFATRDPASIGAVVAGVAAIVIPERKAQ